MSEQPLSEAGLRTKRDPLYERVKATYGVQVADKIVSDLSYARWMARDALDGYINYDITDADDEALALRHVLNELDVRIEAVDKFFSRSGHVSTPV